MEKPPSALEAGLSNDGKTAVTFTFGKDQAVELWDVASGRSFAVLRPPSRAVKEAFEDGGNQLNKARLLPSQSEHIGPFWDIVRSLAAPEQEKRLLIRSRSREPMGTISRDRFDRELMPGDELLGFGPGEDAGGGADGADAACADGAGELQAVELGAAFEQADDVAGVEGVAAAGCRRRRRWDRCRAGRAGRRRPRRPRARPG